jgi:hypothetical protein
MIICYLHKLIKGMVVLACHSASGGPDLPLPDRGGVPHLSVSGDKSDLVVVDPHDPTMTSKPEASMQSLN